MLHRIVTAVIGVVGLSAGLALSAPASARTAWSVSVAGPGYVVSAGEPAYWGPRYVAHHHYHWQRHYGPRVVYTAPVVVAPPRVVYRPAVVYYAPAAVYPAPVVVRSW